jgi:hypothetical protein
MMKNKGAYAGARQWDADTLIVTLPSDQRGAASCSN